MARASHNVKIETDGTPYGTIVSTVDGAEIKGITRIELDANVDRVEAKVTMMVKLARANVRGKFVAKHPVSGELIEIDGFLLPDGSTVRIAE